MNEVKKWQQGWGGGCRGFGVALQRRVAVWECEWRARGMQLAPPPTQSIACVSTEWTSPLPYLPSTPTRLSYWLLRPKGVLLHRSNQLWYVSFMSFQLLLTNPPNHLASPQSRSTIVWSVGVDRRLLTTRPRPQVALFRGPPGSQRTNASQLCRRNGDRLAHPVVFCGPYVARFTTPNHLHPCSTT